MIFTNFFYLSKKHRTFDTEHIKERLAITEAKPNAKTNFKIQSNIASYHIKLGEVKKALQILKPLSDNYPNEYTISANLGTAYELEGQLNKALRLIKNGYQINSESHFGSEWIHIKILEAKIKERSNPGWLKTH